MQIFPEEQLREYLSVFKTPESQLRVSILSKQMKKPDKMAFILSGIFRVFYTTASGQERTLVFRE